MRKIVGEKDKVSVIVIVHNSENYIERCIDTIINQTYKNIEILLVDLYSTDNSFNILERYCEKDKRIKVLKHKIETSLALTSAVKECSGEYITIVRAEDYIEENYLDDMLSLTSDDTNIIISNFVKYKEEDNLFYYENIISEDIKINKYEINNLKECSENNKFVLETIFGKVYRSSILKSVGYLTLNEDEIMKWLYCKTNNIALCNKSNYVYRLYIKRNEKLLTTIEDTEEYLISVIIPVYNVDNYLEECINSVISQTYKKLEIILVNDGSTDRSLSICKKYAEKDTRIKLVTKENGGLSSARNYGLDIATGEFVYFIDSDDFIYLDTIRLLYNQQKIHNSDIVIANYLTYREDNNTFSYYNLDEDFTAEILSSFEAIYNQAISKFNLINYVVTWNKLYRKDLFKNIRFPEGKIFEDEFTTHKLYMHSNSIFLININTYCYRIRDNSIIESGYSLEKVQCILDMIGEKLSDFALFTKGKNMNGIVDIALLHLRNYKYLMEENGHTNHELYSKIVQKIRLYELGSINV